MATAVTLGKVALPDMKRTGYADSLATGAIAAGGTLGFMIPPPTGFVLYAILTEESIDRLFMAGILPGLLLMVLFIGLVWLVSYSAPKAGPLLFVIVASIGGIYLGVFSPVEASGIGAGIVLVLAFV